MYLLLMLMSSTKLIMTEDVGISFTLVFCARAQPLCLISQFSEMDKKLVLIKQQIRQIIQLYQLISSGTIGF